MGVDSDCYYCGICNLLNMQVVGTREAFLALIGNRGVYKLLGVEPSTVSTWRQYLREGKNLSIDKMEEMLLKAGANVVSEKVWEVDADSIAIRKRNMIDFLEELKNIEIGGAIEIDGTALDHSLAFNAITKRAVVIKAIVQMSKKSKSEYVYHFKKKTND